MSILYLLSLKLQNLRRQMSFAESVSPKNISGPWPSHKHTVSLGAAVALDQMFSASLRSWRNSAGCPVSCCPAAGRCKSTPMTLPFSRSEEKSWCPRDMCKRVHGNQLTMDNDHSISHPHSSSKQATSYQVPKFKPRMEISWAKENEINQAFWMFINQDPMNPQFVYSTILHFAMCPGIPGSQRTRWFTTSKADTMSGSLVFSDDRWAVKELCMYWYLP